MTNYRYFEIREHDGVLVLNLSDVGSDRDAANEAGRELAQFAQQRKPQRLLVNFRNNSRLSSLLVGKLLQLVRAVQAGGGRVECCNLSEDFQQVLGMLGRSLPFDYAGRTEAEVIEILKGP